MQHRGALINILGGRRIPTFISQWDTTKAGSAADTIVLPLEATGTYDFWVDWGEGGAKEHIVAAAAGTHTYAAPGTYTVRITGTITGWRFMNGGDKLKITSIDAWGPLRLGNSNGYFYGCSNLVIPATDTLDMTGTTTLYNFLRDCSSITTMPSLNTLDTSLVTDMYAVFFGCTSFNQSVSNFNTANATRMSSMFYGCSLFNQSLANFVTISADNINSMFKNCTQFNQDISHFAIPLVTNMANMLESANNWSNANYGLALIAWAAGAHQNSVLFHAGDAKYPASAAAARGVLIGDLWTITDGGAE